MCKATIADKKPAVIKLEAGTYYWCACGDSTGQPFCDGSHKGGAFHPTKIVLNEPTQMALCNCKQTQNPPYCDGCHSKL